MPFPSRAEYEHLIYTLPYSHPDVVSSSLRLFTVSDGTAMVRGSVYFRNGLELRVVEVVDFVAGHISDYGYTILREQERICWYDPQAHPEIPELRATFPHHRNEPPEIKHNRRPAPGISFTAPNLPALIAAGVALGADLS